MLMRSGPDPRVCVLRVALAGSREPEGGGGAGGGDRCAALCGPLVSESRFPWRLRPNTCWHSEQTTLALIA